MDDDKKIILNDKQNQKDKTEEEIVQGLISKYENELRRLKKFKLTFTQVEIGSRIIVIVMILLWVITTLFLNVEKSLVGTIIIVIGIVYSLILLFKPIIIPPTNNNFSFLLIGLPLYVWIDRRYAGDTEYVAKILFSTGIFASLSMIEYPLSYERSGLIRNIATVYTVLLFLYVLYDLSININKITNESNINEDLLDVPFPTL